jgi:hypothetical protein
MQAFITEGSMNRSGKHPLCFARFLLKSIQMMQGFFI